jgi:uncharacterized protein (DUF1015 family)
VTYDPARVDIAAVLSPPYDVIGPSQQAAYYDRDRYNAVRLVLNRAEGDQRYSDAAAALRGWLADGVLRREPSPALYVHRHAFVTPAGGQGVRLGLLAAVRLEPWSSGAVRPHEHTMPGPKADRLALARATNADLEPIWVFHPDPAGEFRARLEEATHRAPDLAAGFVPVDAEKGERHDLWRVGEPRAAKELAELASGLRLYIADGHHRYETALFHADEVAGGPDDASRFKLMLLTPLEDPGLLVLPTHRLLKVDPQKLHEAYQELRLRGWKSVDASDIEELQRMLTVAPSPNHTGFGVYAGGRAAYFEGIIAGPDVEMLAPSIAALDVAVVHHGILAPLLGIGDDELTRGERIGYVRDASEAVVRVDSGEFDVAILLRPPTLAQVQAVADAGENMPQKSTYFWPKPASGLVMMPQDPAQPL